MLRYGSALLVARPHFPACLIKFSYILVTAQFSEPCVKAFSHRSPIPIEFDLSTTFLFCRLSDKSITKWCIYFLSQGITLLQDAGTSDDSGRASERLTGSSVAPRDPDSSRDRLSDVSAAYILFHPFRILSSPITITSSKIKALNVTGPIDNK